VNIQTDDSMVVKNDYGKFVQACWIILVLRSACSSIYWKKNPFEKTKGITELRTLLLNDNRWSWDFPNREVFHHAKWNDITSEILKWLSDEYSDCYNALSMDENARAVCVVADVNEFDTIIVWFCVT
jgi:hypothetical protein